jgi:hypothetical protein
MQVKGHPGMWGVGAMDVSESCSATTGVPFLLGVNTTGTGAGRREDKEACQTLKQAGQAHSVGCVERGALALFWLLTYFQMGF